MQKNQRKLSGLPTVDHADSRKRALLFLLGNNTHSTRGWVKKRVPLVWISREHPLGLLSPYCTLCLVPLRLIVEDGCGYIRMLTSEPRVCAARLVAYFQVPSGIPLFVLYSIGFGLFNRAATSQVKCDGTSNQYGMWLSATAATAATAAAATAAAAAAAAAA